MDKDYLQLFADNLKKLRERKGLTQDDLAIVDGISRGHISQIETVRTDLTLTKLKIIAKALGVHPKELLDFDMPEDKF